MPPFTNGKQTFSACPHYIIKILARSANESASVQHMELNTNDKQQLCCVCWGLRPTDSEVVGAQCNPHQIIQRQNAEDFGNVGKALPETSNLN